MYSFQLKKWTCLASNVSENQLKTKSNSAYEKPYWCGPITVYYGYQGEKCSPPPNWQC